MPVKPTVAESVLLRVQVTGVWEVVFDFTYPKPTPATPETLRGDCGSCWGARRPAGRALTYCSRCSSVGSIAPAPRPPALWRGRAHPGCGRGRRSALGEAEGRAGGRGGGSGRRPPPAAPSYTAGLDVERGGPAAPGVAAAPPRGGGARRGSPPARPRG